MRNTKTIFLKRACDSKAFAAACESAGKNCGECKKQLLGTMSRLRDEVEEEEEEGEADNDKAKGTGPGCFFHSCQPGSSHAIFLRNAGEQVHGTKYEK